MKSKVLLSVVGFIAVFLLVACAKEDPISAELSGDESAVLAKKGQDKDDCGCRKIEARLSSTGQIDPPLLTATGEMRGDLKGTVNYVANLADVVPMSSGFGNDPVKPTASFLGAWTLTSKKGVLTFRDVGVFEQVPNGLGTSFSTVIDGTGRFAGVSGYLFLSFVSDETGLNFEEELKGKIFCKKHGDEVSNADAL
ncbi:hypothetical protein DCC62_22105 [candidate division KSB1 bacterium]|nr:MAG: hypothetical protein DCC62_22105 [candidate division KSB1 bacterium]